MSSCGFRDQYWHENDMSAAAGMECLHRFCACMCAQTHCPPAVSAKPQIVQQSQHSTACIYMASQCSIISTGLRLTLQVLHQIYTNYCRNHVLPVQSSRQRPAEAINTKQTASFLAAPAKDWLKAQ